jgi:inward rectifier potassium channel
MSKGKPIRLRESVDPFPKLLVTGQAWAPLDDLYHYFLTISWARFFALVSGIYVAVNTLFALLYWAEPGSIANSKGSYLEAFFFSVQTLSTIGYGGMAPNSLFANFLVMLEALTGLLGVALVTGITFAKFARPTARVLFADKIVLGPRDGVPHMMFRMANWRHNQVLEAQLRVLVLTTVRTAEGDRMRMPVELKLVRDRTAFFRLSWTAMHRIDEQSPFAGGKPAIEALRAEGSQIFLTLSGLDGTLMQTVHAMRTYSLEDIVFDARFADVLLERPDGVREMDYSNFHDTIAIEAPTPPAVSSGEALRPEA